MWSVVRLAISKLNVGSDPETRTGPKMKMSRDVIKAEEEVVVVECDTIINRKVGGQSVTVQTSS